MDTLDRLNNNARLDELMGLLRTRSAARNNLMNTQTGAQNPAQQPGTVMSAGPGSADDYRAFNERNRDRALYGDRWNVNGGIGRQGVERDRMQSAQDMAHNKNLADVVSAMTKRNTLSARDKADILQKHAELQMKAQELGVPFPGGAGAQPFAGNPAQPASTPSPAAAPGATPVSADTPAAAPSPAVARPPLSGPPLQPPVAQPTQNAQAAPSMKPPPATVREGLGVDLKDINMMNMPTGGGVITRPNAGGGADYYWMNQEGRMGQEHQPAPRLAPAAQAQSQTPTPGASPAAASPAAPMDPGLWSDAPQSAPAPSASPAAPMDDVWSNAPQSAPAAPAGNNNLADIAQRFLQMIFGGIQPPPSRQSPSGINGLIQTMAQKGGFMGYPANNTPANDRYR